MTMESKRDRSRTGGPTSRHGAGPAPSRTGLPGIRLQKVLAELGLGSRRTIEGWIADGRVRVNGRPAKLGDRVTRADRIRVDGQDVAQRHRTKTADQRPQVIAYNKPEGEVVTRHDPEGRATVFRRLPRPKQGRWIAVGRLDLTTSGLILFTTDGELANRLMHPSRQIEREYAARVLGDIPPGALQTLTDGIDLDDGPARFESLSERGGQGANRWFHVTLREGRNREVRRLWEAVGCRVSRLIRVRYGNVALGPRLFSGHWRPLTDAEVDTLLHLAGLARPDRRRRHALGLNRPAAPTHRSRPARPERRAAPKDPK
jgi:23S rRNA pseudouridine2605 synthase